MPSKKSFEISALLDLLTRRCGKFLSLQRPLRVFPQLCRSPGFPASLFYT